MAGVRVECCIAGVNRLLCDLLPICSLKRYSRHPRTASLRFCCLLCVVVPPHTPVLSAALASLLQLDGVSTVFSVDELIIKCADDPNDRALATAGQVQFEYSVAGWRDDASAAWASAVRDGFGVLSKFKLPLGHHFVRVRAVDISDRSCGVPSSHSAAYEFVVSGT